VAVTAANGDKLLSALTGDEIVPVNSNGPLPPPYAVIGLQQITGGTGRFAGATGSLALAGLDYRNNTITVNTTGAISTVGSNLTSN
jgi:hypothetical protein